MKSASRRALVVATLALAACAALLYWWQRGQPVQLVDAPDARVQCVSYAPYGRAGVSPLDGTTPASPSRIEADLAILSRHTDCVRIYSVSQGLAEVPRIARKLGMKVLLGLWIGADDQRNEVELTQGLSLIARYSDVIKAVIVGNEVLLRREQPVAALRAYIERVRHATSLPVSYADVWEFWLRNPTLAAATSFVTVHILPYWEDDPVPVEQAVDHVLVIEQRVQQTFAPQPVLIGETGWPSAGRNRHGAQPSRVNQARFMREFIAAAHARNIDYNLIEAFDQPWKRALEGTTGGYWGLFDVDGQQKFPFTGPVVEDLHWRIGIIGGAVVALLLVLLGSLRRPHARATTLGALALGGFAAGAALTAAWETVARSSRDDLEWAIGGFYLLCAFWFTLRAGQALRLGCERGAAVRPAPIAALVHWFATDDASYGRLERSLGLLRFIFLFGATTVCLLHVFDARYRDFPVALYAIPITGFALLRLIARTPMPPGLAPNHPHAALEERVLAWSLPPAALWILGQEGLLNPHALAWVALCLLFAASVLLPGPLRAPDHAAREHERTQQ